MPRYIDAEKLEKYIADGLNNPNKEKAFGFDAIQILGEIYAMPTVDIPEEKQQRDLKHGRWERTDDGAAKCTSCKRKMYPYLYGYAHCPLCGAIMDGKDSK